MGHVQGLFFSGDPEKTAGESNKGIFENFFPKNSPYLEGGKKKLEVARFEQCVFN